MIEAVIRTHLRATFNRVRHVVRLATQRQFGNQPDRFHSWQTTDATLEFLIKVGNFSVGIIFLIRQVDAHRKHLTRVKSGPGALQLNQTANQ